MAESSLPTNTQDLLKRITDPFGVYCVLEVELKKGSSLFHLFPVMPESLAVTQRYLQTVTPTQGGVFVDEYGRAPSPVVLQGTFGRSPRPAISLGQEAMLAPFLGASGARAAAANEAKTPLTGYKLMKLLGEMVDISHTPDPVTKTLPTVRFYNFAFGAFYEVTLDSFEASMSVQRNGLWVYRLQMTMIRRLSGLIDSDTRFQTGSDPMAAMNAWTEQMKPRVPKAMEPLAIQALYGAAGPLEALKKKRLSLQTIFDAVQKSERFIQQANAWATGVSPNDLIGLVTPRLDSVLNLTPGTIDDFLNTVRRIPQTIDAIRNIGYQLTTRLRSDVLRDIRTLERGVAEIGPAVMPLLRLDPTPAASFGGTYVSTFTPKDSAIPRVDPAVADLADAVQLAQDSLDVMSTYVALYGYTNGEATGAVSVVLDPPPPQAQSGSSQAYTIRQGDTLSKISLAFYGDENLWPSITQANETIFGSAPDLASELAPTDLLDNYIGTVLTIPSQEQATRTFIPYVYDDPRGVRAFGTDLPEKVETYTRIDGTKDLKVLSAFETLLQGLQHRIATPLGAIPDDAEFGSQVPGLLGQTFGALDDSMNAAKVEEALQRDGRIATVSRVAATRNQDSLVVGFEAVARNAGTLGTINLTVSRQSP